MKNECDIVRDLLPLCAEGLASEASRRLVEDHVAACEECRAEYESFNGKTEEPPIPQTDAEPLMRIRRLIVLKRIQGVALGFALAAIIAVSVFGALNAPRYLEAKEALEVVEMLDECQALALYEEIEGVRYKTLIYCYDGYVRELFFEDGLQFHPADGQPVIAAQNLDVELAAGNLLRLTCVTKAGVQEEVLLYLRSVKGADVYA